MTSERARPPAGADRWSSGLRRAAARVRDLMRAAGATESATAPKRPAGQQTTSPPGRPTTDIYTYAPVDDEHADPGEVVWAWVPFEEDPKKGKDRPVLVIGRDGQQLLALQLTSQDHDQDSAQEAAAGRHWVDIGTGGWDRYRRPSEARVNRLLRLDLTAVRRTGDRLDQAVFEQVVTQVRRYYPQG